ncbi:bifunctional DNA primase/polymerase [Micromonospora sp. NPDC049891]|uniref:bifunctional DNA primase/polymerase n=1 Tax=Micromonospora sp. NPDC049891 TaxID=3155655 RepID=UPI003407D601
MTATLTRSALLDEAYRLADEGRHVFWLGRSKRPVANCPDCKNSSHDPAACACLTCHGFYRANRDHDRIRDMFRTVPNGTLAIRTGAPSGIVVLDVDLGNGGDVADLIRRWNIPPTAWVRTGSGGYHVHVAHPGGYLPCSQSRIGQGVDVRGDGGYAVAPPSVHPRTGRPYVWVERGPLAEMPPALVEACQPPPAVVLPAGGATPSTTSSGDIKRPDRLLAAHLAAVDRAPSGRRRVVLYGSARGVARMVAAGAISAADAVAALTDAGRRAEQTERDIRRAIEGGFHAEGVPL